jgi:hypothetical protein
VKWEDRIKTNEENKLRDWEWGCRPKQNRSSGTYSGVFAIKVLSGVLNSMDFEV